MRRVLAETGAMKAGLDEAAWRWQYERGPHGAIVLLAVENGSLAGYYHVLLVTLRVGGQLVLAGMVQDVAVLPEHRGRGVFRALGAHALDLMRERGVAIVYTFPNRRSEPSFLRDHAYRVVERIPTRIRILSALQLVRQRVTGTTGRALTESGGGDARVERLSDVTQAAPLASAFTARTDVHLDRSSAYLRWRFDAKPDGVYSAWGLRINGDLRAYVVTRRVTMFGVDCAVVMDFGCDKSDDGALVDLIRERCDSERRSGGAVALVVASHPFVAQLRHAGFYRVPERLDPRPFRLLMKPISLDPGADARWYITAADWDVL